VSSGIPTAEADLSQELYKVPSHAAWFGYNAIHDIERKSVPDFFDGKAQSKTPKVWLSLFMLYLTVVACLLSDIACDCTLTFHCTILYTTLVHTCLCPCFVVTIVQFSQCLLLSEQWCVVWDTGVQGVPQLHDQQAQRGCEAATDLH